MTNRPITIKQCTRENAPGSTMESGAPSRGELFVKTPLARGGLSAEASDKFFADLRYWSRLGAPAFARLASQTWLPRVR